jgi:hypothetical protein
VENLAEKEIKMKKLKRVGRLNHFTPWLILAIALVFFASPAQAYIYDDFTSSGIDASRWVDVGPDTGLFSQPGDGYLYFNGSFQADRLRSSHPVRGAFFVSMQYFDFQTTNNQPAGIGQSSAIRLRLESETNNVGVGVEEGQNINGRFFDGQAISDGTKTALKAVSAGTTNSGRLGMYYNGILGAGGVVELWYDSGTGWTLLDSWAPNFSEAPYFSIYGLDQFASSLSFRVDQVQLKRGKHKGPAGF